MLPAAFRVGALALLGLAGTAGARVYYINEGTRYHIGDGAFERSEDSLFLSAYPVVGRQWVEGFRVDRRDRVRVSIRGVWGLDDCAYCKALVWIDGHLMGRLDGANNGAGFSTPEPLAVTLEPGVDHHLIIESAGLDADDFAIEGVRVDTDGAGVQLLEPGPILKEPMDPLPELRPVAAPARGCEGLPRSRDWRLGWEGGQARALSLQAGVLAATGPVLLELGEGRAAELRVRFDGTPGGDPLGRSLWLLAGAGGDEGWVLLFNQGRVIHGNLLRQGDYSGEAFPPPPWRDGWNSVLLRRCGSGRLEAVVNGRPLGRTLEPGAGPAPLRLRCLGGALKAELAP